jgi:hypothetical protein
MFLAYDPFAGCPMAPCARRHLALVFDAHAVNKGVGAGYNQTRALERFHSLRLAETEASQGLENAIGSSA